MVTAEDTTPEHAKACQDLWDRAGGYYNAGPYTPFLFHEEGAPPKSTLQFPGNGGPNWGGTATDPKTGYIYVQTHQGADVFDEASDGQLTMVKGSPFATTGQMGGTT